MERTNNSKLRQGKTVVKEEEYLPRETNFPPEKGAVLLAGKYLRSGLDDYYNRFSDESAVHRLHRIFKLSYTIAGEKVYKLTLSENKNSLVGFEFNKNFNVFQFLINSISFNVNQDRNEINIQVNPEISDLLSRNPDIKGIRVSTGFTVLSDLQLNSITSKFEPMEDRLNSFSEFFNASFLKSDLGKKRENFEIKLDSGKLPKSYSVVLVAGIESFTDPEFKEVNCCGKGLTVLTVL